MEFLQFYLCSPVCNLGLKRHVSKGIPLQYKLYVHIYWDILCNKIFTTFKLFQSTYLCEFHIYVNITIYKKCTKNF